MKNINRIIVLIFTTCFSLFSVLSFAELTSKTETALFAGGCFWSMQSDFDTVPGVLKTTVGYSGGNVANPSYEQVLNGGTGHYESLQVVYDPSKISYQTLLDFYWHHIDPTNPNGQFCDTGDQYRTVIFYLNETQRKLAIESENELMKSGRVSQIATHILPAKTFYPAEIYHQKYYQKNPIIYHVYRYGCHRDQRLSELWGQNK